MKFSEPVNVIKAYNTFHDDMVQTQLRTRWDTDFDLYRQKPYDAGKGYYSYCHNYPRAFVDKVLSMMVQARLIIRLPNDILDEKERTVAGNIERLLYGCLTVNDEKLVRIGQPRIREQLAWHSCLRGGYALLAYLQKDSKGETEPFIRAYDLYTSAYGIGDSGTDWAIVTRTGTKDEVKDLYGIAVSADNPLIYYCWDKENYGVVVNSQWAKEPKVHGLDHCPVLIIQTGEMPSTRADLYMYTESDRGEGILHGIRGLAPIINKTFSDYLTMVRRGVKPPIGIWSAGGTKTIEADIYQVEKGGTVQLDSTAQEDVKPLITPSMPSDADVLIKLMLADEQHAALPYTAFGELGFRLSGFAINQLQSSIITVIAPHLSTTQIGIEWACREMLNQFDSGFKPIKVRGRTSHNQPFGFPNYLEIKPTDIKKDWYPEVSLIPTLPKDDAQRWQIARMATEGDVPLLSRYSALDSIVEIEDPELEMSRIHREWSNNLPVIKLWRAFEAALQDGNLDVARNVMAELKRLLAQTQPKPVAPTSAPPAPSGLAEASMMAPGAGAPAEGNMAGMSPETLPPEALGGMPGGATNVGGA